MEVFFLKIVCKADFPEKTYGIISLGIPTGLGLQRFILRKQAK